MTSKRNSKQNGRSVGLYKDNLYSLYSQLKAHEKAKQNVLNNDTKLTATTIPLTPL